MNLPTNIISSGKAVVQANWNDKVTVTRKEKVGNIMEDIVKYADIKCHFSQSSQPILNQSSTVATTTSIFTLFVDTTVQINSGDNLTIRHKGQIFKGVAGEPFNRTLSNGVKVEVAKIS